MRKLPQHFENPIDNVLLDICDKVMPFFKRTGHTPNMITTYSFILGIIALHYLYKQEVNKFAVFYVLSYFMDCLDGHMARKYSVTSKFGDFYDHITDLIVSSGIVYGIYKLYKNELTGAVILVSAIMLYMMLKHTGCQQQNFGPNGETLDAFKGLCVVPSDIRWTRYFGFGTMNLYLVLLIYYVNYKKRGSIF